MIVKQSLFNMPTIDADDVCDGDEGVAVAAAYSST